MQIVYSHICAAAENNTIGLKGKLPWNIPEDLQFFKEKTFGKVLLMGRKTFESLGKPLPHRLNVVVTRQKKIQSKINDLLFWPWDTDQVMDRVALTKKNLSLVVCCSVDSAMNFCSQKEVLQKHGEEVFIIGGGEIYKQTLPLIHRIYLTRIHRKYKGDAFYPDIPINHFQEMERRDRKGDPSYSFITYEKRKLGDVVLP